MNLLGAIVGHQNSLLQLYRKLEERFEENSIIQTLWHDMAGDVSLQIQSLKSLPSSLWNQFKNAPDNDFESAIKGISSPPADVADISLRDCFEISLRLTEPVVLKIYARIVRLLRKNSTAPALNFYILVKTYVARLVRATESFAGDPLLIRRAQLLIAGLEKEVQEPAPEIKALASRALSAKAQKPAVSGKTGVKSAEKTVKNPPNNGKAAASKSAKAAPVKTKTLPGKTPTKTRRG
ncbi:MAG: hypothetical protein FWF13_00430 [Acidobacteria bacterium]|nr:hypothetical protein [Acidobacteriota bacterium]